MCCTVFLSMWLSNTSTTAMVMPIAEAVLQQLICTGLADSHNDSETTEPPEDDSGTSAAAVQQIQKDCGSNPFTFMMNVVVCSCFRQRREPGQKPAGAALSQRQVCVSLCEHMLSALRVLNCPHFLPPSGNTQWFPACTIVLVTANLSAVGLEKVQTLSNSHTFTSEECHWGNMRLTAYVKLNFCTLVLAKDLEPANNAAFGFDHCSLHGSGRGASVLNPIWQQCHVIGNMSTVIDEYGISMPPANLLLISCHLLNGFEMIKSSCYFCFMLFL